MVKACTWQGMYYRGMHGGCMVVATLLLLSFDSHQFAIGGRVQRGRIEGVVFQSQPVTARSSETSKHTCDRIGRTLSF